MNTHDIISLVVQLLILAMQALARYTQTTNTSTLGDIATRVASLEINSRHG